MIVSQCSPVWKTGTILTWDGLTLGYGESQCSPVWKTGTISEVNPERPGLWLVSM